MHQVQLKKQLEENKASGEVETVLKPPSFREVFKEIWWIYLAVLANYYITLSLFPSIISSILPATVRMKKK